MAKRSNARPVYSSSDGDLRKARDAGSRARLTGDGKVRVKRETAGRKGKGVTTVYDLPLRDDELKVLAGKLKKRCGVGGSSKDGIIELQGDHRDVVVEVLRAEGYEVVLAGGLVEDAGRLERNWGTRRPTIGWHGFCPDTGKGQTPLLGRAGMPDGQSGIPATPTRSSALRDPRSRADRGAARGARRATGRVLETQVVSCRDHLFLELDDRLLELLGGHRARVRLLAA